MRDKNNESNLHSHNKLSGFSDVGDAAGRVTCFTGNRKGFLASSALNKYKSILFPQQDQHPPAGPPDKPFLAHCLLTLLWTMREKERNTESKLCILFQDLYIFFKSKKQKKKKQRN